MSVLRLEFDERGRGGRVSRRQWLQLSGLAGLGLLGTNRSRAEAGTAGQARGFGKARSVILIYASGGQSQIDMWDPKPLAPEDVRGEFQTISSVTPGIALTEHMPRLAGMTDRFTIVRSMSHEDLDHGSATYLALTGRYHQRRSSNPDPQPGDFPTYGAVLKRVRTTARFAYEAVHVNGPALVPTRVSPGQDGGLLGREYEPMVIGDVTQRPVAISGLETRADLPPLRMDKRLTLKQNLDRHCAQLAANQRALDTSVLFRQALDVLSSPHCREAFNLGAEPARLRDRYGRNRSGQACLLARRLVEAGVPLVTVIWNHSNRGQDLTPDQTDLYGWDTHNDIFQALRIHLLPRFDQGFSALLEDLEQRGLLEQTLVICMGEFGRAPRVALEPKFAGSSPGRKHWASVYSLVMAGAGVARGATLGASDRLGAEPVTDRYGPWDVAASMYSALGIDHATHFYDALQRPFPITLGHPIEAAYG